MGLFQRLTDVICLNLQAAAVRRWGSRVGPGHAVAAVSVPAELEPRAGRGRAGRLPAALRSAERQLARSQGQPGSAASGK